jgi:hypothetical protein
MSINKTITVRGPAQVATGMYKVAIVDGKTNKVKWEMPEFKPNLILNSGLAAIATNTWMQCMNWCYAATGTADPNYLDSGATTAASTLAGVVNLSGGSVDTSTVVAGDCILWDTGEQGRITTVSTPTSFIIDPAPGGAGIPAAEFTFCYTTRTTFTGTNAKKCTSYLTGNPNQVSYRIGNVVTSRNTYDFNVEGGSVTYTQIGITYHSVTPPAAATLFSRIVLSPALTLGSGDYLRVVYQLAVTITPTGEVASSPTITGWPSDTAGIGRLYNVGLSTVNATSSAGGLSGSTGYLDSWANEPSSILPTYNIGTMWVSFTKLGHTGSWPEYGDSRTIVLAATNTIESASTTTFTYSHLKVGTWAIGSANGVIRAVGFGLEGGWWPGYVPASTYAGFIFEFDNDADHTKLNTQVLTLRIKYSWGRTLTID